MTLEQKKLKSEITKVLLNNGFIIYSSCDTASVFILKAQKVKLDKFDFLEGFMLRLCEVNRRNGTNANVSFDLTIECYKNNIVKTFTKSKITQRNTLKALKNICDNITILYRTYLLLSGENYYE